MKTGNKAQAVVLSIVAVLAVGFLIYQLVPSQGKPFLGLAVASASPAQGASAPHELTLAVLGNPFSHPMLATKPVVTHDVKQPPSQIDKSGTISPVTPGPLPGVNAKTGGNPPEDNAGKHRLKVQGPRITLSAIIRVGESVAMLAINDKPGQTFSEGDTLAPNAKLIKIGDSSVTVRVNGIEHEIATGDRYEAPEDKTK